MGPFGALGAQHVSAPLRREPCADLVDRLGLPGDQLLGLLAEPAEVVLAGVVEVVAGPLELGLQPDVAVREQRSELEVDRVLAAVEDDVDDRTGPFEDRKSTGLNSSHTVIS